jgi:transposase-like protein
MGQQRRKFSPQFKAEAVQQLVEHAPAVHVRRPKVSQESTRFGLDRTELGTFLVQAGLSGGTITCWRVCAP